MKKYFHIIKTSELFTGIDDENIEYVLSALSAAKRTYRSGEYIFRAV